MKAGDTKRTCVFLYSPELEQYNYPSDCPFKTNRAGVTRKILRSHGMLSGQGRTEQAAASAERRMLEKFHTARYLDVMIAAQTGWMNTEILEMGLGTEDCPVFQGMYEYAALACGATLAGAELILSGQADVAFNPSGGYHHAAPARASGFCYINDVALACILLAEQGQRVLFMDMDVHHGDGVQNAFYGRRDVMTISFHQDGKTLFPGTGFPNEIGQGRGKGFSVNVPLPPGTYDQTYLKAFHALVAPLARAFEPDVIVLELGMDALASDPLGGLKLTNNAYADVVETVLSFAKPILATGGGGYHPDNTARGWALAWSVFCDGNGDSINTHGLGGVMLETTDWRGGLRDRILIPDPRQQDAIDSIVDTTIDAVKASVFPIHGLSTSASAPGSKPGGAGKTTKEDDPG